MGWGSIKRAVRHATRKVTSTAKSVAKNVSSTTKSIAKTVASNTKSIASNVGSTAGDLMQANLVGALGVAEGLVSGKGIAGSVLQGVNMAGQSLGLISSPVVSSDGSEYVFESPYGENTTNVDEQQVNQSVKTATSSGVGANVEGWKGTYNLYTYALKNCLQVKKK